MRFCFIVTAISIYLPAWSVGQWQLNGVAVFDTSLQGNNTTIPHVAPDGEGGAYICWADYRHGNYDIYAQRVDSAGNTVWQRNGVPVVVAPQRQADMQIINDGFGNAIIAWEDDRGTDTYMYAQKVNQNGQTLWQPNGVKVAELSGLFTRITADGLGGVILAWDAVVSNDDVVTQRLDSLGARMWGDSGVRVTDRPSTIYPGDVWIVNDGASGAIVAWTERQINRIYAQRVDSSGTIRWQQNGVLLSDTVSPNIGVACVSDGFGGAIGYWAVNRDNGPALAQRVDSNGVTRWMSGGILLGSAGGGGKQRITSDLTHGAFIGHGLFVQHINGNGTKLWQSSGVPYTTLPSIESTQARTGEGGVWNFCKSLDSVGFNLYRQWIDHTGTPRWGQNGIRLLTINSTQRLPQSIEDGRGNCFVTWEDEGTGPFLWQR
ncbi:MAG TPA: hypothetical protein VNL36_03925 [Bacteroidota bacterium]|nr:hypothetical protein [Bacteroidota bacterium]